VLGALVNGFLQQNGVISRNMGDAIAFCPPLIITETQVDALVDAFERSLAAALPQINPQG
ncbi:MAG: aminotransferase class III-fold pyridoxal phosphate-dependent enzyme, partial [Mesorhizobium sp.]